MYIIITSKSKAISIEILNRCFRSKFSRVSRRLQVFIELPEKAQMTQTSFSLKYQCLKKNISLINITWCKEQCAGLPYLKRRDWGEEGQLLA